MTSGGMKMTGVEMNKIAFKMLVAGIFLLTGSVVGFAGDMAPAAQEEMTEEQKALQARMQEYSTPNEHHEFLKSLSGTWTTNVKFWMDPKGEAQESEGTSEAGMIMGGRFLEQKFNGAFMGQPFEGRGLYGYDNIRKEYTGLWFDNMATGIMISSAKHDPATKTMTEEGSMSCPITNERDRWYKAVTTFVDSDHYTYESFMKDADGKEFRSMIISYTRAQ